jgi:quercetin dioxygenase-like cupin family protein
MAYQGKSIRNTKTGQEIKFLQTSADTNGQLLEMESVYPAASLEPPAHYHPHQEEDFTVEEGELSVRINGSVKLLKKGDKIHIPVNTIHSMWNATDNKTIVNWKVCPSLNTDKTDESGRPPILQVALLAKKYSNVFRLTKPPFALQTIVFGLLTPFAYLKGYRPDYKKYFS